MTEALRTQTEHWRMQPVVAALSSLRGIDFVAAVTLVAEIGDFSRFAHPTEVMGFLGLVPSEDLCREFKGFLAFADEGQVMSQPYYGI